jgi:hypothetical protein
MPAPFNYTVSPTPNNDPADDAPVMQANSLSIKDLIAVDHVGFNDTLGGYHKQISFQKNLSAPGIGGGKAELYCGQYLAGADTRSWPFWQNLLSSTQMMGACSVASPAGYVTLAGGLIVQWGIYSGGFIAITSGPITFSVAFPNNCLYIGLTPIALNTTFPQSAVLSVVSVAFPSNLSGFTWKGVVTPTNAFSGFAWIAVGF